ncbi:MAG: hypothetical protein AWT59_2558 [Candidatus Gallionella acididurans]|uniref:Uncharacterized protein n=1 Tax=Candidatus Gallionella acididurans TaxID=1796491 RepID=A0A139BQP0_9PROT|nr:MAG: hypothetical protein AWT59_2558 [Candidatus Gallionella acididurans]
MRDGRKNGNGVFQGVIMYFVKIYFILGLAMFCVVLWDYKYLPKTANRLVKQPGDKTGFSLVVLAVRNLSLMTLFAFFLWPLVVVLELSGNKEK